jgi:hypothetical protein
LAELSARPSRPSSWASFVCNLNRPFLGTNTGTAGGFVVNGGSWGTPSGGNASNITGLPVATGISGLGTGIASWLATSSSANLATALTDEVSAAGVAGKALFGTAGNLPATATNDNAAAGNVGEAVTASAAAASVALISATNANVTSISLTAGDWDVGGNIIFSPNTTTNITTLIASISTTSATLGADSSRQQEMYGSGTVPGATNNIIKTMPAIRLSLSATTTVYLVAQSAFTVSTNAAGGNLLARRVR